MNQISYLNWMSLQLNQNNAIKKVFLINWVTKMCSNLNVLKSLIFGFIFYGTLVLIKCKLYANHSTIESITKCLIVSHLRRQLLQLRTDRSDVRPIECLISSQCRQSAQICCASRQVLFCLCHPLSQTYNFEMIWNIN